MCQVSVAHITFLSVVMFVTTLSLRVFLCLWDFSKSITGSQKVAGMTTEISGEVALFGDKLTLFRTYFPSGSIYIYVAQSLLLWNLTYNMFFCDHLLLDDCTWGEAVTVVDHHGGVFQVLGKASALLTSSSAAQVNMPPSVQPGTPRLSVSVGVCLTANSQVLNLQTACGCCNPTLSPPCGVFGLLRFENQCVSHASASSQSCPGSARLFPAACVNEQTLFWQTQNKGRLCVSSAVPSHCN